MPGALLTVEGRILGRHEAGESSIRLDVFSPEVGGLIAHFRRPTGKRPSSPPPDLFDAVTLELEKARQGDAHFVREVKIEGRLPALARSYTSLVEATAFARTLWRNLDHAEHFPALFELHERALEAFARGRHPASIHFKSLYLFAKLEGYPVKEDMLSSWRQDDRRLAAQILREPLDGNQPPPEDARRVLDLLRHYLVGHTAILLDR